MAECECFLELEPPTGVKWWRPTFDVDPGIEVAAVAIAGEDPRLRRAVRMVDGWAERGHAVDYYVHITPPMTWDQVGACWAGQHHPVIEVDLETLTPIE